MTTAIVLPDLERFACLVAAAERKALANEFSEAVTKTLESLAATTLMPSPPMPMAIKNLDAIAAAVAAEREACAQRGAAMSMHKTPLTDVEREGLEKHGLGQNIGKPSQLADAFRQGVKWGQEQERKACAKVCDSWVDFPGAYSGATKCAAAIRARGDA